MIEAALETREATDSDAPAIEALFRRVFGKDRPPGMWRWLFRETPAGPGHAVVAVHAGEVIAHAGTITRAFHVGSHRTLCGQSVDAMTDPAWQRQGLNRRLSAALFALHARDRIDYVYGFSNRNSTHTALTHQKRRPLQPFPLLVRPLRIVHRPWRVWLRSDRSLPAQTLAPPPDVDLLWETAGGRAAVTVDRGGAYLAWRYRRPQACYWDVEVREAGRLRAYGVLGVRTQAGMRTAFLMDAIAGDRAAWNRLLAGVTERAHELDCDVVSALSFPGARERRRLLLAGFVPVPERLNPEDIVFSIRRTGNRPFEPLVLTPRAWQLMWGEHDVV